jgi:hypothetical protein
MAGRQSPNVPIPTMEDPMSTRVSAQTRMSAACQQLLRERLNLTAEATVDLANLNAIIQTERIDLPSLQEMVSARPVSATLGTLAPSAFETARSLLTSTEPVADPWTLAASAQAGLTSALAAADTAIGHMTRDITTEAFAVTGAELGYEVFVCRGDVATGIELRREHEILLLRVANGGAVDFDHAGLADAACGDSQRELEQGVARRGITLIRREQTDHGRVQGGNLIRAAAARRDPSLARAVILDLQGPVQAGAPARRRLALADPPEVRRRARRAGGAA